MQQKGQKTDRRDRLVALEQAAQKAWADIKLNEVDPDFNNPKKYFMTFPYPYLNGRLHMGHAFSLTKCDFTARYKRLDGYNTLYPQGFHCTGMPIQASANRLKEEFEVYGNPPKFPARLTDKNEIKAWEKENGKPYEFREFQYNTLVKMNIPVEEIPKFQDPYYWTTYFPPYAIEDLQRFGAAIDFRRSFITTDKNPYYDAFIRWQFTLLHEKNRVVFGKRPSIFSTKDNQLIADHDRASGEGVNPQEYTLIKMEVMDFQGNFEQLKGKKVFLVCATLRPETMYGQTNCYVLPTGNYGAFLMKNDEVFVCSERSAKNMAYQNLTKDNEKVEKIADLKGTDLIGVPLKAPLASFERVYALPMMTIKMDKGTGVVTSVPSDSPDDWAALRDIQNKEPLREKYGLTLEQCNNAPVPIIDIPELGDLAAIKACEEFKVKTQNNVKELALAKEKCYTKGFYEGVLKVGKYAGKKVQEAKPLVKQDLIDSNEAVVYYEPESTVISRTGDECIVALIDQWYLNYADPEWKKEVMDHVKSDKWITYNPQVKENLEYTIDWLKEWGCSRAFGLGTTMPFDKRFLIESLSDSTIYFAYYTIAHLLQGNVEGSVAGTLDIKPEQLNREAFDYIFLEKEYNDKITIEESKISELRKAFNYWYPMDLRCSGKDLIRNHLTMSLFNHAAIWSGRQDLWPKSFYCNGWILVDGKKMSKSEGNFYTISDICERFGADASRFACAEAGDSLEDANFLVKNADEAILKLSNIDMALEKIQFDQLRSGKSSDNLTNYYDEAFEAAQYDLFLTAKENYDEMKFRNVLKYAFHEFINLKEDYILNCGKEGPRQDLILKHYELQFLAMYPIVPHFCDQLWTRYIVPFAKQLGQEKPQFIHQARYPTIQKESINKGKLRSFQCWRQFVKFARVFALKKAGTHQAKLKQGEKREKKEGVKFDKVTIVYAEKFFDWQIKVLELLQNTEWDENNRAITDWKKQLNQIPELCKDKQTVAKCMKFGSSVAMDYQTLGKEILETTIPFNERELYETFAEIIKKECNVTEIEYIEINDERLKDSIYKDAVRDCLPKKAQIVLTKNN